MSPIEMRIRLLHVSLTSTRAELRQALQEKQELLRVNRQLRQKPRGGSPAGPRVRLAGHDNDRPLSIDVTLCARRHHGGPSGR